MARLLDLPTFADSRGSLTVIEKVLPFAVKRVYYIYGVGNDQVRAGHRHRRNIQLLVCVSGSCEIYVNDGRPFSLTTLTRGC
jgi:dTDP-4-dehydrorhamnose 3,5-epimerase-like enzyme